MRTLVLAFLLLSTSLFGQMEMRSRVLYDRAAFRKMTPAVGKPMTDLALKDLDGKKVSLDELRKKNRLVIIGGAYT